MFICVVGPAISSHRSIKAGEGHSTPEAPRKRKASTPSQIGSENMKRRVSIFDQLLTQVYRGERASRYGVIRKTGHFPTLVRDFILEGDIPPSSPAIGQNKRIRNGTGWLFVRDSVKRQRLFCFAPTKSAKQCELQYKQPQKFGVVRAFDTETLLEHSSLFYNGIGVIFSLPGEELKVLRD